MSEEEQIQFRMKDGSKATLRYCNPPNSVLCPYCEETFLVLVLTTDGPNDFWMIRGRTEEELMKFLLNNPAFEIAPQN